MKDKILSLISLLMTVAAVILLAFLLTSITGCAQKPQTIIKYKYIEKKCPELTVYQGCDANLTLSAYNKNNQVCVKEWNSCVDKRAFVNLAKYIKNLKSTCKKYEYEIIEYNKRFTGPSN